MRKIVSLILATLLLVSLCACELDSTVSTLPSEMQATTMATSDPTQTPTQMSTEKPMEKPTEKPTVASTQAPTQKPTEKPTEKPTDPPHTHSFSAATCTKPKTCSCGKTEGVATGHSYVDGTCSTCGASDPDYTSETLVWIPTNGGKKYHTHAGCSNMIDPEQVTKSEAEELGFTPCKRCH